MTEPAHNDIADIGTDYKYGFHDEEKFVFKASRGLNREVIENLSRMKKEPRWMLDFRLKAYDIFMSKPMPAWANTELLNSIDFDNIYYYLRPADEEKKSWEDVPADIRRTFDRLGIPEAERKFLAGVTAQYECLTGDTLVMGNPAVMPISEVKPGMHVYSWDESAKKLVKQKVRGVACKGKRSVFEVNVTGRKIRCTENHPLLALERHKEPGKKSGKFSTAWRYLADLKVGDYVAVIKELPDEGKPYTLPNISFKKDYTVKNQCGEFSASTDKMYSRRQKDLSIPKKTTEDLMWLVGLYLGDGCLTHSEKGKEDHIIDLAIPSSEVDTRLRLRKALKAAFGYSISYGKATDRARIHSIPLVTLFKKLGLDGKAATKKLPPWVFSLPRSQRLALIAGYMDSDGYMRIGKKNCDAIFTSINEPMLKQFQALAITCGLRVTGPYPFKYVSKWKGKERKRTGYRLIGSGDLSPLMSLSVRVAARYTPRKFAHHFNSAYKSPITSHTTKEMGYSRINSIKAAGEEDVYDIEVEGIHNFVAQGVVVHNSEVVYHSIREDLEKLGVLFFSMDQGLQEYPEIVKKYFATVIPPEDNKFAALNSAVWSGGSFIYVPKGVHVAIPLQAYFRINAENMGQFERTLIIVDEGASAHYLEGCFVKGTSIVTNPDYKAIEDVKVGDKVLTHTGRYAPVYHVQERSYTGDLYKVQVYGDAARAIEVTEHHPFVTVSRERANERNRKWNKRWCAANKLKKGAYLAVPIDKTVRTSHQQIVTVPFGRDNHGYKEIAIPVPSTRAFFRLAGYYLAEGSVSGGHYLNFSFNESERAYIDDVKSLLREVFHVENTHESHHKANHGTNVVVSSTALARAFRSLFGNGAHSRKIPSWMRWEETAKQRELILGLFRGDGNYYMGQNKHGRKELFRISTISVELAYQVRDVLLRLGVVASINCQTKRGPGRKPMYNVCIGGEQAEYFGALVATPVKTALNGRKRATMFHIDADYAYLPIKAISKRHVKNISVFNFGVHGDESYVADGVAVHNCTAPTYSSDSLHSAVVELIALPGAKLRYTTIQNWSKNVYNLVTKRAQAYRNATVEWVDGNLGSKFTMKYPAVYLMEPGAHGEVLSIAFSGDGQHQDAGAKMVHAAPNTTSVITSKSISKGTGRTSYRGLVKVYPNAEGCKSSVKCDALLLNEGSRSDTYPTMEIECKDVNVGHEATVSKVGDEQLFYLRSRGLSEADAALMIINGFIEPFTKELPLEYAVELNRLIQLEMEGSVG